MRDGRKVGLCWYVFTNVCREYWHANEAVVNCASKERGTVAATRLESTTAETVDPVQDCADAEAFVLRTFGLIDTTGPGPIFAGRWLLTTSAKKDGLREISQTLVDDVSKHHGFEQYSPEKKARIVSLLMKNSSETKLAARLNVARPMLGAVERV